MEKNEHCHWISVFFILEQSCPLRPKSQKHVPLVVSQIPASLQLFGQVHSKKYYLYVLCITYCLTLFTAPGIMAIYILDDIFASWTIWPVYILAVEPFGKLISWPRNHFGRKTNWHLRHLGAWTFQPLRCWSSKISVGPKGQLAKRVRCQNLLCAKIYYVAKCILPKYCVPKKGSYPNHHDLFEWYLPEQSRPLLPGLQIQDPVVRSHWPLPLQTAPPLPGHDVPKIDFRMQDKSNQKAFFLSN